jgi:histidinol phosphatase-like enzyme
MTDPLTAPKFFFFDIDKTITGLRPEVQAARPNTPHTPNALGEQIPLPGVVVKLATLQRIGAKIALITNRGGAAWGFNSLNECRAFAREAADVCGLVNVRAYLCPHDPKAAKLLRPWPRFQRWVRRGLRLPTIEPVAAFAIDCDCRKPKPGLLLQAARELKAPRGATIYFVGDMESDKAALEAARVAAPQFDWRFAWANEFFAEA